MQYANLHLRLSTTIAIVWKTTRTLLGIFFLLILALVLIHALLLRPRVDLQLLAPEESFELPTSMTFFPGSTTEFVVTENDHWSTPSEMEVSDFDSQGVDDCSTHEDPAQESNGTSDTATQQTTEFFELSPQRE